MTPDIIAAFLTSLFNFFTEMAKGQTSEQKKILWDWYIKDVTFWRKFFGIDKD